MLPFNNRKCRDSFLVFAMFLINVSCAGIASESGKQYNNSVDLTSDWICDSISIPSILATWKQDSLGCLKLRNQDMAKCLVNHFALKGKSEEEAMQLLGNPNTVEVQRVFLGLLNEENDFIRLGYYFDVQCNEKKELVRGDRCWLELIIHPDTRKVVQIDYACN